MAGTSSNAPAVSEMHRDAAPAASPASVTIDDPAANRAHFFPTASCPCNAPPSKDAVRQRDHYWDCCGCPEIDPHGPCGCCACCGCGCKLAVCCANLGCVCLPSCAGCCANKVREAYDFEGALQTMPHNDAYPARFSEAIGLRGKCVWAAACCNLHFPFGNAGFAWCGRICWTEEYDS